MASLRRKCLAEAIFRRQALTSMAADQHQPSKLFTSKIFRHTNPRESATQIHVASFRAPVCHCGARALSTARRFRGGDLSPGTPAVLARRPEKPTAICESNASESANPTLHQPPFQFKPTGNVTCIQRQTHKYEHTEIHHYTNKHSRTQARTRNRTPNRKNCSHNFDRTTAHIHLRLHVASGRRTDTAAFAGDTSAYLSPAPGAPASSVGSVVAWTQSDLHTASTHSMGLVYSWYPFSWCCYKRHQKDNRCFLKGVHEEDVTKRTAWQAMGPARFQLHGLCLAQHSHTPKLSQLQVDSVQHSYGRGSPMRSYFGWDW